MPAVSQQQYKYMQAVANGSIKDAGMTAEQAREYISKNTGRLAPHNLPKIKKMMKGNK